MPAKEQEETRGKIYNDIAKSSQKEEPAPEEPKKERVEPIVTAKAQKQDEQIKPVVEEEDNWGAIPAFLRRNKK
jgi:hypothetical protein